MRFYMLCSLFLCWPLISALCRILNAITAFHTVLVQRPFLVALLDLDSIIVLIIRIAALRIAFISFYRSVVSCPCIVIVYALFLSLLIINLIICVLFHKILRK